MVSNYKIITVTHKQTDLKNIGRYVIEADADAISNRLEQAGKALGIDEIMYLFTCNRVLYLLYTPNKVDSGFTKQFAEIVYGQDTDSLDLFSSYEGEDAIRHLYEVASSIDSLVVGEREIFRQLREAYTHCHQQGLTGDSIRLLMDETVRTAKRVYASTRIGEKPVSIVSLAIQKLLNANVSKEARVILLGAGQTNTLVGKFLAKHGFTNVAVFNRTMSKAEELAALVKGQAYSLDQLPEYSKGFDVMFTCVGTIESYLTQELYLSLANREVGRKIIIDLAIPNNVSPDVKVALNVKYISIEDLKALAERNLSFRAGEVEKAGVYVEESIDVFNKLYKQRQVELAMSGLPQRIREVKDRALEEVFRKEMENLDDDTRALIGRMMGYMEKKCIGIPMKVAKDALS